jgi:hypothetical protein
LVVEEKKTRTRWKEVNRTKYGHDKEREKGQDCQYDRWRRLKRGIGKQTSPSRIMGHGSTLVVRSFPKNYASQKQKRIDRATRQVGSMSDRSFKDCQYCEGVGAGFCG